MKKRAIQLLLVVTAFVATSCNNNNDWDYPSYYTYATVVESAGDKTTGTPSTITFELDNGKTFYIYESKPNVDLTELSDGERVVTGVTFEESENEDYTYSAKLYEVIKVVMGDVEIVTTQEEYDDFADDELYYLSTSITLSYGYLNILTGFVTDNIDDVEFYLIESDITSESSSDDSDYLSLELRYDKASDSNTGELYERYVSFSVESLKDKLEDLDGIALRINTAKSDIITIKINSKDLF